MALNPRNPSSLSAYIGVEIIEEGIFIIIRSVLAVCAVVQIIVPAGQIWGLPRNCLIVCSTLSVEYLIKGLGTSKLEKFTVLTEVETASTRMLSTLSSKLSFGKSSEGLLVAASC